jgi:adenylyltransferase/sulfurtransferase
VLGVLPGIIGSLQANEALKLLLGIGEPLVGRLLLFDALGLRFREVALPRDPACPVCSARPTQTGLVDYDELCGTAEPAPAEDGWEIEVEELRRWRDEDRPVTVLDVRTRQEWEIARLPGSRLIPLAELPGRLAELDPATPVVALCHFGPRSAEATRLLREHGFRALNLTGGLDAWSERVDPAVPRY